MCKKRVAVPIVRVVAALAASMCFRHTLNCVRCILEIPHLLKEKLICKRNYFVDYLLEIPNHFSSVSHLYLSGLTHFPSLVPPLPVVYMFCTCVVSRSTCTTTCSPPTLSVTSAAIPLKANGCGQLQVLSSEGPLTIKKLSGGPEWSVMNDCKLCVSPRSISH